MVKKFKKKPKKQDLPPQEYVDGIAEAAKKFGSSWIFPMMILFEQQKSVIKQAVEKIFKTF